MAPLHTSLESDLVVVATLDSIPEAHVARTALESLGIQALVADDYVGYRAGRWNARGGIRLVVRAEDAQAAREFLDQANAGSDPRFVGSHQRCPHCWSTVTDIVSVRKLSLLSWLRNCGPLFETVERLRCGSCGRDSVPDTYRP
jgi:hypothetical protein